MTTEQKQRILEMRNAGMGYSRIATSLSLSVNTVKTFAQDISSLGFHILPGE